MKMMETGKCGGFCCGVATCPMIRVIFVAAVPNRYNGHRIGAVENVRAVEVCARARINFQASVRIGSCPVL